MKTPIDFFLALDRHEFIAVNVGQQIYSTPRGNYKLSLENISALIDALKRLQLYMVEREQL